MTRPRRNEGEEERRLRERKESRYRDGSESDSEEERRLAEAERKRNARKRRPTANIPECSSTSEQPSNVTNSNIAISRSAPEEKTPKARLQQSRRPPVMEDPPNIGSQPGTSTECNQIGRNKDERAKEDSRIPEELNEREIVAGPSTSLNLSETRREKNRLAQQKYRQRRKEQQREDELNRIREQTRQRLTLHRQRLNQEQEGQIRQQDREAHSEQRQRLTQEQQDQIRQQNRTAHSEQRQRLTQEQQDQIRQQNRTAHSEQRQRLTQEQQDQIRQQNRTAHSEQRQSQTPQRRLTTNARRRVVVANRRRQLRLGREYEEDPLEYHCGSLSLPCSHCGAFYFPGDTKIFYSVDSIDQLTEDKLQLSEEFLHSLRPANLPPHKLELKIGCIVMLIRNLNVKQGLCNGTRLQVDLFGRMNAIQCRFINGVRKGETVIIPRIDLMSSKGRGLSFVLTRRQFPFKLAFAMTINKAQGQSLNKVEIYLPTEVFSHGQLYVALSRAKTSQGIKVFIKDNNNRTLNIVDRRAL